ncbi:MAG TPA: hypothetical protein VNI01_09715 [Elusimicrobiota bacterium]|jgi:hypothetical protein|nr:hypothetical protein [Elusimicrobiota bacterium]
MKKSLVFCAFAAILSACAGAPTAKPVTSGPDWVNKGSGAFKDGGQSVFYGVGIFRGSSNPAMVRTAADERARVEIAKTLDTFVTSLYKDYMAATTAGDQSKTSDEQHVEQAFKNFSKFTLNGATVVDHWKDADGTMYALAKLDLESMKKSLENAKELNSKERDFVRANAEKAFDNLDAEAAKH